jgi:hypothetical protein
VSSELSFSPCACCGALLAIRAQPGRASHCARCEVAYLEFKLRLLLAACRASTKTDEV